ncbi:MAG TPA: hypothetical protein PKD88_00590 [Nitrosomonas sp.]|nr:hypothetical protein [Nitrosomonas sp.]HMW19482.1 hypothetical protein [Nitrosomonas sp.]HMY61464.1 hypothetical protein [Nitrosomonas sp.]HMY90609.1 hypothetical protein [Nitrosomonas sp.]HNA70109.1 hypothetical protein [Nitrosomonas sp.]
MNSDSTAVRKADASSANALQVNIRMQSGEHTGQPIFSNLTSVQASQGVVVIDFGFIEPQMIQALSRLAQSGEKAPDTISAKMSCRMVVSVEAASQLAQQLSQLFVKKT